MCEQVEKIKIKYGLEMRAAYGWVTPASVNWNNPSTGFAMLPRWVSTEYLMHIGWVCVWI